MKVIFWGLVIIGLGYVAYGGMLAGWSWLVVANAVDEDVSREAAQGAAGPDLKDKVLRATDEAGVSIDERGVLVTQDDGRLAVQVFWTVPFLMVRGEPVISVPLSVERTAPLAVPAGR